MFEINVKKIDETQKTNCGSFLQTPFWCEFKANHGWQYNRFELQIIYPKNEVLDND